MRLEKTQIHPREQKAPLRSWKATQCGDLDAPIPDTTIASDLSGPCRLEPGRQNSPWPTLSFSANYQQEILQGFDGFPCRAEYQAIELACPELRTNSPSPCSRLLLKIGTKWTPEFIVLDS